MSIDPIKTFFALSSDYHGGQQPQWRLRFRADMEMYHFEGGGAWDLGEMRGKLWSTAKVPVERRWKITAPKEGAEECRGRTMSYERL